MDDWVARSVAPTHWKLRGAIAELKVEKHRGKTTIGRVERGFDVSGYHIPSAGPGLAPQTIERFKARMARLYERGADADHIAPYAPRWVAARATLTDCAGQCARPWDLRKTCIRW